MLRLAFVFPLFLLGLAACQDGDSTASTDEPLVPPLPAEIPAEPRAKEPPGPGPKAITGVVVETMDSGDYTYVKLDAGAEGEVWAAGLSTQVAAGDRVSIIGGMLMQDFESKTLNRTFKDIYFAQALRVVSRGAGSSPTTPARGTSAAQPEIEVEKIDGGYTVAELFEKADALDGEEVTVRGQVVKFNRAIMDMNWVHIQDGTGTTGSNDLTVTTDASAQVGDVVVVRGRLATDKDFGAGYSYPVIVEGASIDE